jgi:hypothetical protein
MVQSELPESGGGARRPARSDRTPIPALISHPGGPCPVHSKNILKRPDQLPQFKAAVRTIGRQRGLMRLLLGACFARRMGLGTLAMRSASWKTPHLPREQGSRIFAFARTWQSPAAAGDRRRMRGGCQLHHVHDLQECSRREIHVKKVT